jgi:mRNA-degrading endonuclease RelE of RelBE toxin-antitoxin system
MYEIQTISSKVEKKLREYLNSRNDIKDKLDRLKENPYRANGAHLLKGKLFGKWACWLGSNIRAMYIISNENKTIMILSVGTHNIY